MSSVPRSDFEAEVCMRSIGHSSHDVKGNFPVFVKQYLPYEESKPHERCFSQCWLMNVILPSLVMLQRKII